MRDDEFPTMVEYITANNSSGEREREIVGGMT
jgi:hypothetical protein